MYLINHEEPTNELRFNTFGSRTEPYLEQKWHCRDKNGFFYEWRKVPFVEQPTGEIVRVQSFASVTCD